MRDVTQQKNVDLQEMLHWEEEWRVAMAFKQGRTMAEVAERYGLTRHEVETLIRSYMRRG